MTEELQKVLEMLADKYGTTVSELIAEIEKIMNARGEQE